MKRVVISGVGALSPLGHDWKTVEAKLRSLRNAVQIIEPWKAIEGLNTQVGAPAAPFELPAQSYTRKATRSMGRVALMAVRATELALEDAGLLGDPLVKSGKLGIAYGSSAGTPANMADFGRMVTEKTTEGITANTYLRMMSHTAPVNIGVYFGITGRIVTTSSACTSGSQGIGYAYEAVRSGRQVAMVAGGSEELDATGAAIFDTLFATSTENNDTPELTPRPFNADRSGLVLGEGACTVVLEELEHARARGARILAEVVGYGTNSDGAHITQPNAATMAQAMRLSLEDAGLSPSEIGYVNAHGTGTDHGDAAETAGTHAVFGARIPISSLKSYMGHTLGACGALEAWMTVEMMRSGWFAPTLHLRPESVDPRCAPLEYLTGEGRRIETDLVMSNNFAFGGINTSLIFRRWE
jgi:3-oxoacyl-[acyl-carrier-protein] synthase II